MQILLDKIHLEEGMKVIDLGGSSMIWQYVDVPLEITFVNLTFDEHTSPSSDQAMHHNFTYLVGDACNVEARDGSYDFVFSNSVIEHVGNVDQQRRFAHEVKRLAPQYWVQTPAVWFPLEAHTGMPFWWFYPASLRSYFINKWREKLPAWTDMIEGTTIVRLGDLKSYFPDASIATERSLGIVKSYSAYRSNRA